MNAKERRVHLHTMLECSGGAAGVAHLLGRGLIEEGWEVSRSSEIPESGPPPTGGRCRLPGPASGTILHLHSTSDWRAFLEGMPQIERLAITLHDCSLLTGGCIHPLECSSWREGCPGRCSRRYPDAGIRCLGIRAELKRLDPVLVAPSSWIGAMARSVLPGLRVRVVPNGVEWGGERPVDKAASRQRLGINPAAAVVLFAAHGGQRSLVKGGALWERIWSAIKAQLPAAVGLFVGGDRCGRREDLLLLPYVDRATMGLVMRCADLLVYPSLADNHPLVVLEAMSRAVGVAAFDVGGVGEQIRHGLTGILVPPGDWRMLADRAAEALRSGRAARLGREAWELGRTRYAVGRMVADHVGIYERLTRDGRGVPLNDDRAGPGGWPRHGRAAPGE
jgi:glycosyltransferase involved in cell wall biosynthesis